MCEYSYQIKDTAAGQTVLKINYHGNNGYINLLSNDVGPCGRSQRATVLNLLAIAAIIFRDTTTSLSSKKT